MTWLLVNWRYVAAGAAVLFAVTTYHQWKDRIAAEAVAEERLADLEVLVAHRDSVAGWARTVQEQAREDSARYARRLDSLEASTNAAIEGAQMASQRAVEAGDSLSATLDSVRVVLPELGRTAQNQWAQIQEAEREEDRFQRQQRDAERARAETFRDAARTWQERFNAEREVRLATEDALAEARSAIEAQVQASQGGLADHWIVKGLVIAGAGYAGYQLGLAR